MTAEWCLLKGQADRVENLFPRDPYDLLRDPPKSAEIAALKVARSRTGEAVQKQKNYFANQAGRMNYQAIADRGWPIGSGPVESSCAQDQCRFQETWAILDPARFSPLERTG